MRISRRMGLYTRWRLAPVILYDAGTEHPGGIGAYAYGHIQSYSTRKAPNISRGVNTLTVRGSSTTRAAGSVFVEEKIDMTRYSVLKVNVSGFSITNYVNMFVVSQKANEFNSFGASVQITSTGEWSIDLSNVEGSYYIVLVFDGTSSDYFTITKWWLE